MAALVTIVWPPEVMSPPQIESASLDDPGGGKLMDLSSFELASAEDLVDEEALPEDKERQRGELLGRDPDSLTRQGEILAHEPTAMVVYLDSMELHPGV